ncbi:MAG: hypothetical protein M1836_004166 [Candelina mexicana]|nr:MAG: hypothetical protein M1836_004166 [Candelina mexicana]
MLTSISLLTLLTTLLSLALAQEYPGPVPSNIKLSPADLSPQNSMVTRSLEWHNGMALAFVKCSVGQLQRWGSFDINFKSAQFYTINLYKYGEEGYESPRDCFNACQAFLGQAIGAGLQEFQCDHYGGGKTHCWLGYGPKINQKHKREWRA